MKRKVSDGECDIVAKVLVCFLAGIGAGLETGIVLTVLGAAILIVNLAK